MPQLKEEYPTHKHSQLQEKLFKEVRMSLSLLAVVEEESAEPNEPARRRPMSLKLIV